ncbi:unnamed protein product [Peniophora sp. CBMAI 1063]|nr:unnamed protein product [Peniophora sp. CBMAI 1063]
MACRKVFTGSKRKLVLAFDLGTTFSGVSFVVLDPGNVPRIQTVTRYPGQEAGDTKIPTIVYYDKDGHPVALGAEEPPLPEDTEDDDEWQAEPLKLEWFKLLLRPGTASLTLNEDIPAPQLPGKKTIVDVYADFYGYLFRCARTFIQETHTAIGALVWESMQDDIEIVLSHPNGWGGPQQSTMRRAVIQAGILPDTPAGRSRVTFVSEGEASLHYCVSSGLLSNEIEAKKNMMVIDAGGGTVDISTYSFKSAEPVKVEEIAPPNCLVEGSVIVRHRAEALIRGRLVRSKKFSAEAYIQAIVQEFDKVAKKRFKGTADANVKFSNLINDRDVGAGIRNGALKLTKDEMCSLFDPAINAIVNAIEDQRTAALAHGSVQTLFLVGGFASSEYVFERLQSHFGGCGLTAQVYRPDAHANKAVAEGAISFYVDHHVSARVARWTYGTAIKVPYDPSIPSHAQRTHRVYKDATGTYMLENAFYPLIQRGTQVAETEDFSRTINFHSPKDRKDTDLTSIIFAYRGSSDILPTFLDEDEDSFVALCKVSSTVHDVPSVDGYLVGQPTYYFDHYGVQRKAEPAYRMQTVDIVISFGLTELKAHMSWVVRGKKQRSPASVIYEDDFAITVPG